MVFFCPVFYVGLFRVIDSSLGDRETKGSSVCLRFAKDFINMNYQGRKPLNIRQLLMNSQSKQGAITTKEEGLIRVEVPSERTMYYFTQDNHPIHPSVVIRAVVIEGENIKIKTKGYTSGNQQLFEEWLKQFSQQDLKIKGEFN